MSKFTTAKDNCELSLHSHHGLTVQCIPAIELTNSSCLKNWLALGTINKSAACYKAILTQRQRLTFPGGAGGGWAVPLLPGPVKGAEMNDAVCGFLVGGGTAPCCHGNKLSYHPGIHLTLTLLAPSPTLLNPEVFFTAVLLVIMSFCSLGITVPIEQDQLHSTKWDLLQTLVTSWPLLSHLLDLTHLRWRNRTYNLPK